MTSFDPRAAAGLLGDRPVIRAGQQWDERPETYFEGRWEQINPLNIPGPFYGAETDTCEDGPPYAPASLFLDDQGQCFVWRQPRDEAETYALMCAASSDPLGGHAWDGDEHWTPDLVRGWWSHRAERSSAVLRCLADYGDALPATSAAYRQYWQAGDTMAYDLRRYIYFLENRSYPAANRPLPSL